MALHSHFSFSHNEVILNYTKAQIYCLPYLIGTWHIVMVKAIPGGVNGDFFHGTLDRTMSPEADSVSESEYQKFLLGYRRPVPLSNDLPPL